MRFSQLCWIFVLVLIAAPSHAGPICTGFWDCLPLASFLFLMHVAPYTLIVFVLSGAIWVWRKKAGTQKAGRVLRFVCFAAGALLVFPTVNLVTTASSNAKHQKQQREKTAALDFKTFRIEKLPAGHTASPYRLNGCIRDLYEGEEVTGFPTVETINTRIENSNGEYWGVVYQLLPPKEGSLQCDSGHFEIPKYCHGPSSSSCEEVARTRSGIALYRAPRDFRRLEDHFYFTLDGTLVIFSILEKTKPEDIGWILEAAESMRLVTPSELTDRSKEFPLEINRF
jgi:hypothetical protein